MSISEEKPKKLRIRPEALSRFFESVGASSACPICKREQWKIPGDGGTIAHAFPWATPDGELYMNGVPVIMMVCGNCSFVRPHAFMRDQLRQIMEEIPESD